jgi:hypothetical protein
VLINLCETVGYCNQNNVPACIVAIDQAKAFDTISNSYMLQAYRFFGLGEYMINLLTTLGSGRVAYISFDDGSVSDPFDLERGRKQGNGPSPCEYNIGQQILLLSWNFVPNWLVFIWYTHKTSSYITSSYKTSSYKTSIYQMSSYRMSRLQKVQVTKRPFYKTSRLHNVQDTKRPVFLKFKNLFKKTFFTKYAKLLLK